MSRKSNKALLREFKDQLPVKLSEKELLTAGARLAQCESDLSQLYGEKEAFNRVMKAREGEIDELRSKLALIIREKHESRDVPATAWADYELGIYWEERSDAPGVPYNKRKLEPEERQQALRLERGTLLPMREPKE